MRHRLSGRHRFAAVRAERISAGSGGLRVHVAGNGLGQARVGFVIRKSVGGAVVRNTVRRRLRAAIHPHLDSLGGLDVVVVASVEAAGQSYRQLAADLGRCLERAAPAARARSQRRLSGAGGARLAENVAIRPGPRRALAPTSA